MGDEERVQLWDAIHAYVRACGGDPGAHVYGNTERQLAVVGVEDLVNAAVHNAHQGGRLRAPCSMKRRVVEAEERVEELERELAAARDERQPVIHEIDETLRANHAETRVAELEANPSCPDCDRSTLTCANCGWEEKR